MKTYPWISLDRYGLRLRVVILPSNGHRILVCEGNTATHTERLTEAGFQKTRGGLWFTRSFTDSNGRVRTPRLEEIARYFPEAGVRQTALDEIFLPLAGPENRPASDRAGPPASADTESAPASRGASSESGRDTPQMSSDSQAAEPTRSADGSRPDSAGAHANTAPAASARAATTPDPQPDAGPAGGDDEALLRSFVKRVRKIAPKAEYPLTVHLMPEFLNGTSPPDVIEAHIAGPGAIFFARKKYDTMDGRWYRDGAEVVFNDYRRVKSGISYSRTLFESWEDIRALVGAASINADSSIEDWYATHGPTESIGNIEDFTKGCLNLGPNDAGNQVYERPDGKRFYVLQTQSGATAHYETFLNYRRFIRAGTVEQPDHDGLAQAVRARYALLSGEDGENQIDLLAMAAFRDLKNASAARLGKARNLVKDALTAVRASSLADPKLVLSLRTAAQAQERARSVLGGQHTGGQIRLDALVPLIMLAKPGSGKFSLECGSDTALAAMLCQRIGGGKVHIEDFTKERALTYQSINNKLGIDVAVTVAAERFHVDSGFVVHAPSKPAERILNPEILFDELLISRDDHLLGVQKLACLNKSGAGVVFFHQDGEPGSISPESRAPMQWAHDHFNVIGFADLSPDLSEQLGFIAPVRMMIVNGRRADSELVDLPAQVPVLGTLNDYHSLIDSCGDKIEKTVERYSSEELAERIAAESKDAFRSVLQVQYEPLAKTKPSSAMVPVNLATPHKTALQNLSSFLKDTPYPTIEDYVASAIGATRDELAVFEPEQIDALGLAISKVNERRGFLLTDMTGVGKGRVLAGLIRHVLRNPERKVIFLTEREDLIRLFWKEMRKVVDIKDVKPYVINSGAELYDISGVLLDTGNNRRTEMDFKNDPHKLINNLNQEANILLATYSQMTKSDSAKVGLLRAWSPNSLLILDESHKAAGWSKSGENLRSIVDESYCPVFSSATWSKMAKNVHLYKRAVPVDHGASVLAEAVKVGGEPLQEIMCSMLAEDGVLVRREHDSTDIDYNIHIDRTHYARNRQYADAFADFMAAMSYLGGSINQLRQSIASQIGGLKQGQVISAGNVTIKPNMELQMPMFGSRFHILTRQFLLAISADAAVERGLAHHNAGRKPIIVLDSTAEELLRDVAEDKIEAQIREAGVNPRSKRADEMRERLMREGVLMDRPPMFSDLLKSMIERSVYLRVTNPNSTTPGETISLEQLKDSFNQKDIELYEAIKEKVKSLYNMANDFPNLPMSPIDSVRDGLEARGVKTDEVTGRVYRIRRQPDGKYLFEVRPERDREVLINDFNDGRLDAVIINRSAFSGVDMHSAPHFGDTRQRAVIELQVPENPTERMQSLGRANRRGQVSKPVFETISSGLPADIRVIAMQNQGIRRLSANTTANRESRLVSDTIDLLNPIGNEACIAYLSSNPGVANLLGIKIDVDTDNVDKRAAYSVISGNKIMRLANTVTVLMSMMPVEQQEKMYKALKSEYDGLVAAHDAAGTNPLKLATLPGTAKVLHRKQLNALVPGTTDGTPSVFAKPLYLSVLQYQRRASGNLKLEDITAAVESGKNQLIVKGAQQLGIPPGVTPNSWLASELRKRKMEILSKVHSDLYAMGQASTPTLKDELEMIESPARRRILAIGENIERLATLLPGLKPGAIVQYDEALRKTRAVLTSISFPEHGQIHNAGQYSVGMIVPFWGKRSHTLSTLLEWNLETTPDFFDASHPIAAELTDNDRFISESCLVIDGNPLLAAVHAVETDTGRTPIVYQDELGERHHGIKLRQNVRMSDVTHLSFAIPHYAVAPCITRHNDVVLRYLDDTRSDIWACSLSGGKRVVKLTVVGKDHGMASDVDILARLVQNSFKRDSKNVLTGNVDKAQLGELVALLEARYKITFRAPGNVSEWYVSQVANGAYDMASTDSAEDIAERAARRTMHSGLGVGGMAQISP